MTRKVFINFVIILLWLGFGFGYFMLFEAGREAQIEESETNERTVDETAERRVITASLATNSRSLNPDTLCLSTTVLSEPPWTNPRFQEAIQMLNIGRLRIPGGEASGFWNWQTGQIAPLHPGQDLGRVDNTLESYLVGLKATGTEPILTLNMVTADLPDQLAMLQAVEVAGIRVTAVELGYRAYLGQPNGEGELIFPTVTAYTAEVEQWAEAIRSEFPEAAIALSAAPPTSRGYQDWNSAVFSLAASQKMAVAFTPYPESPIEVGQPFNGSAVTAVLGAPFQSWQQYTDSENGPLASLPADVPIWMSEYNLWPEPSDQTEVAGTWAETLFVATQTLLFLSDERVEFICPHPLLSRQKSAAFLAQNQTFQLLPTGRAVQMLGRTMSGMTTAHPILFNNVPVQGGTDYPQLLGYYFEGDGGEQTAVIINLGASSLEINIMDLGADFPSSYQQTVGNPTRPVRGENGYEVRNGTLNEGAADANQERFLILPHYSVTTFSSVE